MARSCHRDLSTANELARVQAGYVWTNDHGLPCSGMPFAGIRNSGTGREESIEEYESYLETIMRCDTNAALESVRTSRARRSAHA